LDKVPRFLDAYLLRPTKKIAFTARTTSELPPSFSKFRQYAPTKAEISTREGVLSPMSSRPMYRFDYPSAIPLTSLVDGIIR
jgi:hypothetical protein|tara:strand:- start:263 stop:508 length:246 start_codon:yes stop_codon:yes gene_type:complete